MFGENRSWRLGKICGDLRTRYFLKVLQITGAAYTASGGPSEGTVNLVRATGRGTWTFLSDLSGLLLFCLVSWLCFEGDYFGCGPGNLRFLFCWFCFEGDCFGCGPGNLCLPVSLFLC